MYPDLSKCDATDKAQLLEYLLEDPDLEVEVNGRVLSIALTHECDFPIIVYLDKHFRVKTRESSPTA